MFITTFFYILIPNQKHIKFLFCCTNLNTIRREYRTTTKIRTIELLILHTFNAFQNAFQLHAYAHAPISHTNRSVLHLQVQLEEKLSW